MKYIKPALSFLEQCDLLQSRKLIIQNRDTVCKILSTINYYRLSAYFRPFQVGENHQFKPGTNFNDILNIYHFDKELRILVFEAMEYIEVSFRTRITHYLSKKYGAFGYADSNKFSSKFLHKEWMKHVDDTSITPSPEIFIRHYKEKYTDEKYFPVWMVIEVISMGQLCRLFKGLKAEDQNAIEKTYDIQFGVLRSWLLCLSYIRNLCAHHSRLWNRRLAIRPKVPKNNKIWLQINNHKFFAVILIFQNLLQNKQKKWIIKLNNLLTEVPVIFLKEMGFPNNWKEILNIDEIL